MWGSFVVARTTGSLLDLVTVMEHSEGLYSESRYGPWRVGLFLVPDLECVDPVFQTNLAAETGAPALSAYVLDSDTAFVEAWNESNGFWRACLARDGAASYVTDPVEFEAEFLSAEAAAEHAIAWARDGGLTPDAAALGELFALGRADPFADDLVLDLVKHLGVQAADPDDTRSTAPDPSLIRGVVGRHPLDALVHEHAIPVMTPAGFTRRGRSFRRTTPTGDAAVLTFECGTPYHGGPVTFTLDYRITPAAWRDAWLRDQAAAVDQDIVPHGGSGTLPPPAELPGSPDGRASFDNDWEVDPDDPKAVTALRRVLADEAVPLLTALAEPGAVLDADDDPRRTPLLRWPVARLMAMLDLGPTPQLAEAWKRVLDIPMFDSELQAWAQDRLRDRFALQPGWEDGPFPNTRAGDVNNQLAGFTDRCLAPTLPEAGFDVQDGAFQRRNDFGDQLVVQPILAWSATGKDLVFSIEACVVPAMELHRRLGHRSASTPLPPVASARAGWCRRRLTPPAEHSHRQTQAALGLDLWHITDDETACPAAQASLREWLPTLLPLLDREYLTQLVTTPDTPPNDVIGTDTDALHNEIVLRLDTSPQSVPALLASAAKAQYQPAGRAEFIAWARSMI